MRVLIRLPNWIGDAVMAVPAVLALGEARPDWEWWLLARPGIAPLFAGLDEPFHLMPWPGRERPGTPGEFWRLGRSLRAPRFDGALVLPPSLRAGLEAQVTGARVRVGWGTEGRAALLTSRLAPTRERPLRAQYFELAAVLLHDLGGDAVEIPRPGSPPAPRRVPLRAEEIDEAERWGRESGLDLRRVIALAPGAAYGPTKRWPAERFAELATRLLGRGFTPLWFGGPAERELCRDLAAQAGGRSIAGECTLRDAIARLAGLRALVSNDSGAMHLGQAAGCPVVGIFGSTSPDWTGPAGEARVVRTAVSCSPCFAPTCPTQIECLTGLSVERVEAGLEALLAATADRRGRPAAFLDRDGTVIEEVNYLTRPEQVRLVPGAAEAMRRLDRAGYALILITNQSAIARGLLDRAGLQAVHLRLRELLAEAGIRLTGIEYCPHHPDFGAPCACRKPEPGMLRRAAHRFDLDLSRSVVIGDTVADLEAGRRAGCESLLVRTGHGAATERELGGDQRSAVFDDLGSAVSFRLAAAPRGESA